MKKTLAALAMTIGFAGTAQAGILFEPYVGYDSGKASIKDNTGAEAKSTSTSVDAGLRLGIRNMGFWIAAEGMMGTGGKTKPEVTGGPEYDFTGTTLFGTIGYDFSTRIRLFAGVGFQDSVKMKDATGVETTYSGGTAMKAGLGFYLLPHVCLNAEYVTHDYKKYKTINAEGSLSDLGIESMKSNHVLVTLSFPITF